MSELYDEYIKEHKENVGKAADWLYHHLPEIFNCDDNFKSDCMWQCKHEHDASKWTEEEYGPYDAYFYGKNRSYEVVQEFNHAWLHHIHNNAHHWQYWILNNDDPNKGEIILDMPDNYIFEMICDWWSFSWAKGNLYEIFDWYNERKNYIKLSDKTRKKVEDILERIKDELDQIKEAGEYADQETMEYGG